MVSVETILDKEKPFAIKDILSELSEHHEWGIAVSYCLEHNVLIM